MTSPVDHSAQRRAPTSFGRTSPHHQNETTRPGLTNAQQQQVIDNMGLVHHIVSRVMHRFPSSIVRDDITQVATMGLIEAVTRFDPDAGTRFSSFAGRRIEGAITDHLRSNDWAPRSVRAHQRKVAVAEANGARTDDEIARLSGLETSTVAQTRVEIHRAALSSIDSGLGVNNDVADMNGAVDTHLMRRETLDELRQALNLLPERQRLLVESHFLDGRTLTEIATTLGVTQSRASQLKSEAVASLRRIMITSA